MRLRTWLGVVGLLIPAAAAAQTPVLSLEQAVKQALDTNDRIVNQRDTTRQAALGVRLARNAFTPKIIPNVVGSFGQSDINSQTYRVDVAQKFVTGTELRAGVGTATAQIPALPGSTAGDLHFYNADTTFTLSQPLLRGFGRDVSRRPLDSAELRRTDAGRQQALTDQQVAVEVASAYYGVVAQQTMVSVAKRSVDRARKLRDASESKLGAGLVSQLDVLRAQQLVAQAEMQWFDAQAAGDDARERLLLLMGHESNEPFEVDETIPTLVETLDATEAVGLALERRLDLKSVEASTADADRQMSYARNQLLPQVDVNVAFTRRETSGTFVDSFGLDRFRFFTFMTIAMPVDRTPQVIDYENALIDRDRRRRDAALMRRRIADEVMHQLRERDRLVRTLAATETSVDIARKEVEIAQLRYERGLANNLDVVTAETDLLNAEGRRMTALANQAIGSLSLRATLGVLDPRQDFHGATAVPLPGRRSAQP